MTPESHVRRSASMTLSQFHSIRMHLKNHLVRASKPFRNISEGFLTGGVSNFFTVIFRFRTILAVMEMQLMTGGNLSWLLYDFYKHKKQRRNL